MPFIHNDELNTNKYDIFVAVGKLEHSEIREDILFIFDNIVEHLALYNGELVFSAEAVEMLAMLARTPEEFHELISMADYMRNGIDEETLH